MFLNPVFWHGDNAESITLKITSHKSQAKHTYPGILYLHVHVWTDMAHTHRETIHAYQKNTKL